MPGPSGLPGEKVNLYLLTELNFILSFIHSFINSFVHLFILKICSLDILFLCKQGPQGPRGKPGIDGNRGFKVNHNFFKIDNSSLIFLSIIFLQFLFENNPPNNQLNKLKFGILTVANFERIILSAFCETKFALQRNRFLLANVPVRAPLLPRVRKGLKTNSLDWTIKII